MGYFPLLLYSYISSFLVAFPAMFVPYAEITNWERWVIYDFRKPKLLRMFESLPESVADALGIIKRRPPNSAVVVRDKQGLFL